MIDEKDTLKMLHLHDLDGKPVSIRQHYIIAALGHADNRAYTKIEVDGISSVQTYKVREPLEAIEGPFATLTWLKFNPDYLIALQPNKTENGSSWPLQMVFRAPSELTYVTSNSPEEIETAMASAHRNHQYNR